MNQMICLIILEIIDMEIEKDKQPIYMPFNEKENKIYNFYLNYLIVLNIYKKIFFNNQL